jgi:hypothetical protein
MLFAHFKGERMLSLKRLTGVSLALGLALGAAGVAHATPNLQLDIAGGTYDPVTETVIASSNPFTLYALVHDDYDRVGDTFYISAAVIPKTGPADANLGSFSFDGNSVAVTADMTYGVPPLETALGDQGFDANDLSKHGIFETFFSEFAFTFNPANTAADYNTADNAGAGPQPGSGLLYQAFTVDVSGLTPGTVIHFDLYNTKLKSATDIDRDDFAPFSHDAQSGPGGVSEPVPEPMTTTLGALSLGGLLAAIRRRRA